MRISKGDRLTLLGGVYLPVAAQRTMLELRGRLVPARPRPRPIWSGRAGDANQGTIGPAASSVSKHMLGAERSRNADCGKPRVGFFRAHQEIVVSKYINILIVVQEKVLVLL